MAQTLTHVKATPGFRHRDDWMREQAQLLNA
jgi:hypothetical protein